MSMFATAEDLYQTVGAFLEELMQSDDVGPKFVAFGSSFEIVYTDPEAAILVDCTHAPPKVVCGGGDAEITLRMSADDGHLFWLGKLNVGLALAKNKVKVEGQISKVMALLPAVRPAFKRYPEFLGRIGRTELIR